MNLTRRGILGGLIGLIAAPAIVRAVSIMPLRGNPLILPPLVDMNAKLILFRKEMIREYVRENLFSPYVSLDNYGQRMWVDWSRNAIERG